MADQTSNHVVRLQADFKDFVRAAEKAGRKSSDVLSKAIEAGIKTRSFVGFEKGMRRFEKVRAAIEKKSQALTFAIQTKNNGKLESRLKRTQMRIAKLTSDLDDKNISGDLKKKKKAERVFFNERLKYLQKLNEGMGDGLTAALSAANRELKEITAQQLKSSREMERSSEQVTRATERQAEFSKMFRRDATRGADDFTDSMTNALNSFKSQLSGMDIGSMLSGGAAGAGKGLAGIGEMLGGIGAAGGATAELATAAGALLMVIGPLVAAVGIFAGLMFEMDKEVKEFNKSAINSFGTRSVMNVGMGSLEDNLKVLRHSVQDLTTSLGLNEQEAMGVFDAYDAGGITLQRLTKGATDAAAAEQNLQQSLRQTVSVAKSLGIGVGEFAGQLADYTDTLAFSLQSVTDQFAMVSKQASDAGFSTRRFYSFIVQASAGQASLNTHLDQTGDLLIKMSKALGMKQAAEVLGGAASAFQDMSTSDRFKTIMTTGAGRTKETISRSAEHQAASFLNGTDLDKLGEAIATSGVSVSKNALSDPQALVRELAGMTRTDQARLQAAITASSDKEISASGRAFTQLITVSRGTTGSMQDMADAMSGLDPGATIAMKLQSAMAILGQPLNELTGVNRMAAEQITGLSGAQFEQYQALAAQSEGQWSILKSIDDTSSEQAQDIAKSFGVHFDEQGQILDANNQVVADSMGLLTTLVDRTPADAESAEQTALNLAEESFDATTTISDILQNQITNYLRSIYEDFGMPLLDTVQDLLSFVSKGLLGVSRDDREATRDFRTAASAGMVSAGGESSAASRTISHLGHKKTLTDEEKTQLEEAHRTKDAADAVIEASKAALSRVSRGDLSDIGMASYQSSYQLGGVELATRDYQARESGTEAYDRLRSRAGGGAPTVTAPATAAPMAAAPTVTAQREAQKESAHEVSQPITDSVTDVAMATKDEAVETRSTMETEAEESRKHLEKILTKGQKLGNALADSRLPDAIVQAQVKQQLTSLAFASGLNEEQTTKALEEYFEKGTLSSDLMGGLRSAGGFEENSALAGAMASLGIMPGARGAGTAGGQHRFGTDEEADAAATVGNAEDDFIYRGNGVRGTITPIDSQDTLVGSKEHGALDRMSGGSTINISIYGGDERRIFDVVKRALTASGAGSRRVTAGA